MTRPRPPWRAIRPVWSAALARQIAATSAAAGSATAKRSGYLVINSLNLPRRAAVVLPDADLDLRPDGPLRAAQFTDEGVWAVVDLPAFGFAWVAKDTDLARAPASTGVLSARGRQLKNESIEVEIDAVTGGMRSLTAVGESTARLGQQLVMTGLYDAQGKPVTSQMRCDRFDVDYGGPRRAVQATSATTSSIHQ